MAGIEIDLSGRPVIINGSPRWIRPVCDTPHGEVPNDIAKPFQLLNIIELEIPADCPNNYQSENVFFDKNTIRVAANFDKTQIINLCNNNELIFGNKGKAVSQESIDQLTHSLMLISVTEFHVSKRVYEDRLNKPQTRLVFTYKTNQYDLPVTDPAFLNLHQQNNDALADIRQIYLTLSLGSEWDGWYYKLIAGIIH